MNECKHDADSLDADKLGFECSDEAIEAAAGVQKYAAGALTLSFCSGLDTCPA